MADVDINLDPSTTKYLIRAQLSADGVVEKPDVVGAIFGQTEGLLGNELDLRDLQKSGRIGRIEVDVESKKGKTTGSITLPSSLDKVETAILAAAVESIDRVGPCRAEIKVQSIEDVRVVKRSQVINRAKQLLVGLVDSSKDDSTDITEEVRATVRAEELISFGPERLPAGPHILKSDAIIVVEGRNDVINLLKHGIKNAVAVEGTSVPKSVQELTKDKVTTVFVDGDRGGELILKELFQTCEIDFVARAPKGREVEELQQKNIMKCLRNKVPAEQFAEIGGIEGLKLEREGRPERAERAAAALAQERATLDRLEARAAGTYIEEPELQPAQRREERPPQRREERDERRGPREERGGRRDDRERGPREDRGPREAPRPMREREERGGRRDDRERGPPRGERGERGERGGRPWERREGGPREGAPRPPMREPREHMEQPRETMDFDDGPAPASGGGADEPVEVVSAGGEGREARYLGLLNELGGKLQAVFLDEGGQRAGDAIPVRDLADTLRKNDTKLSAVVFDGVITQRLLDIASEKGITTLVGVKTGNITKRPGNVEVVTRADLERA
ncbi:MAG TPA: DNA primase DnaG [Candidatus Thermoplasmatota archaeon]|jgi:DNA primase|nr:DNA primase DnaG [Candidatus Thermoplasmatota archaeon]